MRKKNNRKDHYLNLINHRISTLTKVNWLKKEDFSPEFEKLTYDIDSAIEMLTDLKKYVQTLHPYNDTMVEEV